MFFPFYRSFVLSVGQCFISRVAGCLRTKFLEETMMSCLVLFCRWGGLGGLGEGDVRRRLWTFRGVLELFLLLRRLLTRFDYDGHDVFYVLLRKARVCMKEGKGEKQGIECS